MKYQSIAAFFALLLIAACNPPEQSPIVPPQPEFTDTTQAPNPQEHRIYADVDPLVNGIILEWKEDTTFSTTAYMLYRSTDSILDDNGVLKNKIVISDMESTNTLLQPLPVTYRDTMGIAVGTRYWYQLQAFYRAPTGKVSSSLPSKVDLSTSFKFETRLNPASPLGGITLSREPVAFIWDDPQQGGEVQIIVERTDSYQLMWSAIFNDFGSSLQESYPPTAPPFVVGGQYRWRLKRIDQYGGSSSYWTPFKIDG